jgi:hypothetical protein
MEIKGKKEFRNSSILELEVWDQAEVAFTSTGWSQTAHCLLSSEISLQSPTPCPHFPTPLVTSDECLASSNLEWVDRPIDWHMYTYSFFFYGTGV